MFTIVFHKHHLKTTEVWYAKRPNISKAMGFHKYNRCECTKNVCGFIRNDFYTKIINLTRSPDELLGLFNKTTQYEIKRSIREGTKFFIETDINAFTDFYNEFASSRRMALLESSYLAAFKNNLFISKGIHEDECLVMHANIIDKDTKRVCICRSASLFKAVSTSKKKQIIGRANRFLHFADMIYAKDNNMLIYDLGGYALNTEDKILQGINKFKDGFGGELKLESDYTSYPMRLRQELRRFKDFLKIYTKY